MRHYGVTLNEIMTVTREMNLNANGGVLYEYGNEYIVRGVLSTDRVDQLARAVVRGGTASGSAPILLEDIADVHIGAKLPKLGTASERGKAAVLLTVTKQPATSTLELTDKLEASLEDLQKNLPPDVKVSTDIFRQSRFIESSTIPVPCKCTYNSDLIGYTTTFIDYFTGDAALYGIHNQHNESRWSCHRYRFVSG